MLSNIVYRLAYKRINEREKYTKPLKMKKIYLSFRAQLVGVMEFEVAEDFKLSDKQADQIWEELRENYPDQIETDIFNHELQNLWGIELGGFQIDDLELDSIESYYIKDNDGEIIEEENYIDNHPLNLSKMQ